MSTPVLHVTPTDRAPDPDRLAGFRYFWIKGVRAFDPSRHCARCLVGPYASGPGLGYRETLPIPAAVPLGPETFGGAAPSVVYVCGVSGRYADNLHLALLVEPGAVAEAETFNGYRLRVEGARRLDIPPIPDGAMDLPKAFTTCRNFQFGVAAVREGLIPYAGG